MTVQEITPLSFEDGAEKDIVIYYGDDSGTTTFSTVTDILKIDFQAYGVMAETSSTRVFIPWSNVIRIHQDVV